MTITAIEPKRKRLSAIYIDGEFAMKLDTEAILMSRFSVGSEINDEELKDLIDFSNEKRAKEKALWLISYRDHSKKELMDKLKRTADQQSAEVAAERMEELGLIDDEKFARKYANELINVKHLSKRAAQYKLYEKGIDKDLAQEILDEFEDNPRDHISAVIERKYRNAIFDEKGKKRAVNALLRMGYGWSDINCVLNDYIEEDYI